MTGFFNSRSAPSAPPSITNDPDDALALLDEDDGLGSLMPKKQSARLSIHHFCDVSQECANLLGCVVVAGRDPQGVSDSQ